MRPQTLNQHQYLVRVGIGTEQLEVGEKCPVLENQYPFHIEPPSSLADNHLVLLGLHVCGSHHR